MTTYVFGQKKQRISVVLYEEFTGDGSDVTFQLTDPPANATWLATHGAWAAGNIHTTYPAHITKTNKKPIYDSIIPLTRNRITVSSISAGGLITLDYAPRNNADFYVWYWYQLSTDDILSAYYRADFMASMEGEMIGTVNLYDTDSSNVLTMAWNEDDDTDRILNLLVHGADRTLDLYESLKILDGQNIELHASGGEKAQLAIDTQNAERTLDMSGNLTVESNSIVNQDLSSDASPTFANLSLGTGELTTGSINRASGTLTLEIAGSTILSVASADVTLANGIGLNLQEDITFTGATTENQIKIPNNLADALSVLQGGNKYITIITTTDLEDIVFYKSLDILHTAVGAGEHALEIDADAANYGDIKAIDIDYITGTIATGQDEGIILINIDQSEATGGDIFALEVLATEAADPTGVYGLKAGALVGPVHQGSGTFGDMDSALVNDVSKLTAFITSDPGGNPGTNNVEIFSAYTDTVTIGDAAKFEELEFLLETVASGGGIKPTFEFSTAGDTWTSFTPVDGTDGMRHSGVIAWEDADIPAWVVSGGKYLIRITRTRGGSLTPPVEDKVQIAAVTVYVWDENGDVSIRGLTLAGNLALAANSITGTSVDISNAELQQLSLIGATTISAAQWGYLGACGTGGGQLLAALTTGESDQLELIGATTISATQWGYLGGATANGGALIDAADYAAMMVLLSGEAGAAFSFNSQNLTSVGAIGCSSIATTGVVGVGGAGSTSIAIRTIGDITVGAYQYGCLFDSILSGTTQSSVFAMGGTVKANTTVSDWRCVDIVQPGLGSGAAITTLYGIYIPGLTRGSTNYAIYVGGGNTHLGGDIDLSDHDAATVGLKLGGTLVTASAAKLNLNDGSVAGTIVNSKSVIYGSSGEVNATTFEIAGNLLNVTTDGTDTTVVGELDVTGLAGADPSGHKAVYYNTTTKSLFYDNT